MPGAAPRRALLEALALAALLLVGVALGRSAAGVLAPSVALALVALGPLFRRALVLRGLARPLPTPVGPALLGLEVLALGLGLAPALHAWALALLGLAALGAGWPGRETPGASSTSTSAAPALVRAAPWLVLGLAVFWILRHDPDRGYAGSSVVLANAAVLATFALAPGAARTAGACARRLAAASILAALALLANHEAEAPGPVAAVHALALAAAALEVLAWTRERGAPSPASPRAQRALRLAFGSTLALLALVLVPYRLLAPERTLDLVALETAPAGEGEFRTTLSRFWLDAPGEARVLEDGAPVPVDVVPLDLAVAAGGGHFALSSRELVWWTASRKDPRQDGRRHELAYRPAPHRSLLGAGLVALAAGLLVLGWSWGAFDLERRATPRARALATLLVAAALAAGLPARWDRLSVSADTASYLEHSWTRPLLYPAFLDALDSSPLEPRERATHAEIARGSPPRPGHRFLGAVHVQKLLALLGVAALVWVLAGLADAWAVALLAWLAVTDDVAQGSAHAVSPSLEGLVSEGLSNPLLVLFLAALVADLARPRWRTGLLVPALLALMVLVRPSNAIFGLALPVLWLRDARQSGARPATRRALVLGLVLAAPLLLACARTFQATGFFRLHAFTGRNVFCTALSLATPEDVDAFPEPELHEIARRCIVEEGAKRIATTHLEFVNVNLYDIGFPVLEGLHVLPEGPAREFAIDDTLGAVGKRLVLRHPVGFARLTLEQLARTVGWETVPLVLGGVLGSLLWWRRRRPLDLAAAFLLLLPLVAILPSCAVNSPIDRYRAPLAWIEVAAVPLLLALLLAPAPEGETGETPGGARS